MDFEKENLFCDVQSVCGMASDRTAMQTGKTCPLSFCKARLSVGKKREYISLLEQGKIDMQLSTFMLIAKALGLKFSLVVG